MTDTNYDLPEDESYDNEGPGDTDFDLADEYKPEPLAPAGAYKGNVKSVGYEVKNCAAIWTIVAEGNEGLTMLDGETPVDGTEYQYRNWLPREGDENIISKNGKSNKRQNKINMLKQFQDEMGVDMNTKQKLMDAINNSEWVGIPVIFKLDIREYPVGSGRNHNEISRMSRDSTG